MGYTTPFTAVAGTAWKASDWNTYGRDNIAWLATDSPSCNIYNSANESTTDSVDKLITYNSEYFDNAAMHSTSSNTSRVTIPTGGGGKYIIGASVEWGLNVTGWRILGCKVNGTTFWVDNGQPAVATSGLCRQSYTTVISLSAADYAETRATQNSGGALNITYSANASPDMWAFWFRN